MAGFIIPRGRQDLALALQAFQSGAESFGKNSRQAIQDEEERKRLGIAQGLAQQQNTREQQQADRTAEQFAAGAPMRKLEGERAGLLSKGIGASQAFADAQGRATGIIPPMGPLQAGEQSRPSVLMPGFQDASSQSSDFLASKKLEAVNHFRSAKGEPPITIEEYNQDREVGKLGLLGAKQKLGIDAKKAESDLLNDAASRRTAGALADKYSREEAKPPAAVMPLDVKNEVAALSHKNAAKISISNQIGSYLAEFKKAKSDDDKVRIGGLMLKALNSPEGADAIGVEEAKRLGDALEYNLFDVKAALGVKPGKLIGRDLAGFEKQVQSTYDAVSGGVKANRDEVDRLMGRTSETTEKKEFSTVDEVRRSGLPKGTVIILNGEEVEID